MTREPAPVLDEISLRLMLALVNTFHDPRRKPSLTAGVDSLHLGIFAGLLPPEALEQPRKYRPQVRVIVERLQHLETLELVTHVDGRAVYDGAQPTAAGFAHVAYVRRPWWRSLLDRFSSSA